MTAAALAEIAASRATRQPMAGPRCFGGCALGVLAAVSLGGLAALLANQ